MGLVLLFLLAAIFLFIVGQSFDPDNNAAEITGAFGVALGILTLGLVVSLGIIQLVYLKQNKEFDRQVEYYYYLVEESETKDLDLLVEQVRFEIELEIYKNRYYDNFWLNWFNNNYVGSYNFDEVMK